MIAPWRGVIEEYREFLPVSDATPVVTLLEGNTPLLDAPRVAQRAGVARVWLKVEGLNPTASFKDRGMTMAMSVAVERGAKLAICASTGNTSASAAAYAARAGLECGVVLPAGRIALGKLAQALIHGAQLVPIHGNFDDALTIVRELGTRPGVEVVNSVNEFRIEGQKTAAFEVVDILGDAPTAHCLPVGNAGNITAYWRGYTEYHALGRSHARAAHARLASGGIGADRVRRAGPAPRDHRHRDPHRQSGVVGGRGRGTRRIGRPHRRGQRRARSSTATGSSRPKRAASWSRRRRRRWPGCSRRQKRASSRPTTSWSAPSPATG